MRANPTLAHQQHMQLNGNEASADDLRPLILSNYGHFTSMQMRGRAVRGLALHLQRLDQATQELFGCALPSARVLEYLRSAIAENSAAAMLRVSVFQREAGASADVLVALSPPAATAAAAPPRVQCVRHQRYLPRIKHLATFSALHLRKLAQAQGYDDVLFVDEHNEISEGSVWNVGFYDGARVVWPSAPALPGVTLQLLQTALLAHGFATETRPVHQADLSKFSCAFFSNARVAVQPIARIDAQAFSLDEDFYGMLNQVYEAVAWEPIS